MFRSHHLAAYTSGSQPHGSPVEHATVPSPLRLLIRTKGGDSVGICIRRCTTYFTFLFLLPSASEANLFQYSAACLPQLWHCLVNGCAGPFLSSLPQDWTPRLLPLFWSDKGSLHRLPALTRLPWRIQRCVIPLSDRICICYFNGYGEVRTH